MKTKMNYFVVALVVILFSSCGSSKYYFNKRVEGTPYIAPAAAPQIISEEILPQHEPVKDTLQQSASKDSSLHKAETEEETYISRYKKSAAKPERKPNKTVKRIAKKAGSFKKDSTNDFDDDVESVLCIAVVVGVGLLIKAIFGSTVLAIIIGVLGLIAIVAVVVLICIGIGALFNGFLFMMDN